MSDEDDAVEMIFAETPATYAAIRQSWLKHGGSPKHLERHIEARFLRAGARGSRERDFEEFTGVGRTLDEAVEALISAYHKG